MKYANRKYTLYIIQKKKQKKHNVQLRRLSGVIGFGKNAVYKKNSKDYRYELFFTCSSIFLVS